MKITKTIKHLHKLKFTPLEFETNFHLMEIEILNTVKIYSVGV